MKKFFNPFYLLLIIGALSTSLTSCDDDDDEDPDPAPGLTISNIDPLTARAGDTIRIAGSGFSTTPSENVVYFNQSPSASAQVIGATISELKVKVPAAAPNGPIKITVGKSSAVSAQTFTLNTSASAPAITAINPTHGLPGSEVIITGNNLVEGSVIANVTFGTMQADIISSTPTSVKVKVPQSLTQGQVDIKVIRSGQSSNIVKFVVDPLPKTVKATYWTDGVSIFKGSITETGVNIETLYDAESGVVSAYGIAFNPIDNKIYFAGGVDSAPDGAIFRAPADGTGPVEELYTYDELNGGFPAYDIALDFATSTLYVVVIADGKDQIVKGNYGDLSKAVEAIYEVNTGSGDAVGVKLTVADNKLYWAESISKQVVQGSLDGAQDAKVLFDGSDNLGAPYNIAVDASKQKIFILDNPELGATATDAIHVGNLDGSGTLTKIVSAGANLDGGFDIEVDTENQFIIWLTPVQGEQGQKVNRCKYDGTGVETLFSGDQIQGAGFFDIDIR